MPSARRFPTVLVTVVYLFVYFFLTSLVTEWVLPLVFASVPYAPEVVGHRGARPQVANTLARGQLHEDSYFYTGLVQGANGYREEKNEMPFPVTLEVLKRGQERFNIYCTPCHSRVGNGLGKIVQRGYKPAANLQDQVRLSQPISHYFYVMTHGYGAMPDYSAQLLRSTVGNSCVHSRIAIESGDEVDDVPRVKERSLKEIAVK